MIRNADEGAPPSLVGDVCIIGTGPAGLSLARQLAKNNVDVVLVEGGDLSFSETSQELYKGTLTGLPYRPLDKDRVRFFGGSSNHWTGHCGTLDAQDFEAWHYHPLSGWPIRKADLDTYIEPAKSILDIAGVPAAYETLPAQSDYFQPWTLWESPPTRFGEKYRGEIAASTKITCVLNLNLLDIVLADDLRSVNHFVAESEGHERTDIQAKYFVLCLGGIENPRTLLNANTQVASGIGNGSDLVGRFFSEHLMASVGKLLLVDNLPSHFLSPTTKFREAYESLNFGLRAYTRDGLLPHNRYERYAALQTCPEPFSIRFARLLRQNDLSCEDGTLFIAAEQSLNPHSRVSLAQECDRYGKRKVNLNWELQDLDWHTIISATVWYGEYLIKNDLGRVKIADWLLDRESAGYIEGGHHHMCTTRMGLSRNTGVVDSNGKVFEVENLYLGGSSVFATVGHINPTFTIVQLALRLGDHLSSKLGKT